MHTPPDPSKPRLQGLGQQFGVLDITLFFAGIALAAALATQTHGLGAKAGLVAGLVLVALRRWFLPLPRREARPHTAPLGVLIGLIIAGAVVVLSFAAVLAIRCVEEPDWDARRAETVQLYRDAAAQLGLREIGPRYEADLQADADRQIGEEQWSWVHRREKNFETALVLLACGCGALGLAAVLERLRTRPA